MSTFIAARAAAVMLSLLGGLLVGGCGGGSDSAAEASLASTPADPPDPAETATVEPSSAPPPVGAPATEPVLDASLAGAEPATELVANGRFDNGLSNWAIDDAVLATSQLRSGGRALNVGWRSVQRFAPGQLVAGKAYTLIVKARNEKASGSAQLAVTFRRPAGAEVFRAYEVTIASNLYQDHKIEFTAPAYAAMAELSVVASGTRVIVDSASLKQRTAIVQTEGVWTQVGSYVPAGYVLAFNDEFNGTTLNRSKWFTRLIYAGGTLDRMHDEKQRYRDNNNHVVANGLLNLTARRVQSNDPQGIDYESGMIRSDWSARYGYFEARVKMPGGLGVWPAFWLVSDVSSAGALSWPPEIDVFEFVNNGVEDKTNMLHSGVVTPSGTTSELLFADPAFNRQWSYYQAPFNFNEAWHTIGAEWTPTTVTLYVDGKKIYTRGYKWNYPDGTAAGPAHILLNLAVGGAWAGRHGINNAAFPQALQINWVRAYSKG